jgi:hypothetical protein
MEIVWQREKLRSVDHSEEKRIIIRMLEFWNEEKLKDLSLL